MIDLLNIVSSVFGYILFGFFLNKLQILPKKYIDYFDFTGFNILLPLALIIYFWQVSFPQINSIGLIISFFASGIFIKGEYNYSNNFIDIILNLSQNNEIYLTTLIKGNLNNPNISFDKNSKFFQNSNSNENNIIEENVIQFLNNFFDFND